METPLAQLAPVPAAVPATAPCPEVAAPAAPRVRFREIAGLVSVCALADLCLYARTGGAGQAALLVLVPVVLVLTASLRRLSSRLVAVGALVVGIAARLLWQPSLGTLALGIAAVIAFALALRAKRSYVPELVVSAAVSLVASVGALWRMIWGTISLTRPRRLFGERRWVSVVAPIAAVVVFAALFSAANPVFEQWMDDLWSSLAGGPSSISGLRVLLWIASAVLAALLLHPVLREPTLNERLGPGHVLDATDVVPSAAARSTARNVLVAVNVLFLVYNALDATYLWAGRLPAGIGYTTYAHRGAMWLTVSLAVSTFLIGILFRGPMSLAPAARIARVLAYVWAAQNLVLAAGTLRRISLYVDHSGLTRQLILGVLGTLLVCAGLALIVTKLARRRTGLWLVRRELDALAIAAVAFVALPTEAISVRFNVARVEQGQYRPLLHLFKQPLTGEGAPALVPLLDHPNPVVRRGAAGLLRAQRNKLAAAGDRSTSWTEWEWSRSAALGAIRRASPAMEAALPDVDDRPGVVEIDDSNLWALSVYETRHADLGAIERLRRLAFRCRSSVAKPIACDPIPIGTGRPPETTLRPVRIRPLRGDDSGSRVK